VVRDLLLTESPYDFLYPLQLDVVEWHDVYL
jgi:hypothetical protein